MKKLLIMCMFSLLLLLTSVLLAEEVTVGSGVSEAATPINTAVNSSLFQGLFFPDELNLASGSTITGMKLYVNSSMFIGSYLNHQTQIWLGNTTQGSYGPANQFVPAASMTQVFNSTINLVLGSTVTITFSTPFTYNGNNLVLYVARPGGQSTNMMGFVPFACQTLGSNRAVMAIEGMMGPALNPLSPPSIDGMWQSATGQFPKTTFIYTPAATANDLTANGITGASVANIGSSSTYAISVKNNGTASQTSYLVKLYANDVEVASTSGNSILSDETQSYNLSWTPAAAGGYILYGKVELIGDENALNDQTANFTANAIPVGTNQVTVGSGGETDKFPIDVTTGQSLFETLYYAAEVGGAGTIYGIVFYNNFQANALNQTVAIWLGETTSNELTTGWIGSGAMSQVYYGSVNFPMGQNTISIFFDTPYVYTGQNLVMMMQRPLGNASTSFMNSDVFITQTRRVDSSRYWSDFGMGSINTESPSGGGVTGEYPMTSFYKFEEATLPVELSSFNAVLTSDYLVNLNWVSESETGLIGYKAYRSETNDASSSILVSSLISATNTSSTHSYSFTDEEVVAGGTYYYWLESIDYCSSDFYGPVSITIGQNDDDESTPDLPEITVLKNAFPNPFAAHGITTIRTFLKDSDNGVVQIYNTRGQAVRTFKVGAGFNTINWDGKDRQGNTLSSGIYLYKLITPSTIQTKKLTIMD
jgi:hypothetical protein